MAHRRLPGVGSTLPHTTHVAHFIADKRVGAPIAELCDMYSFRRRQTGGQFHRWQWAWGLHAAHIADKCQHARSTPL